MLKDNHIKKADAIFRENAELRALHEYIEQSLWDKKMNCVREYWLWERKRSAHKNQTNFQNKGDNYYETV